MRIPNKPAKFPIALPSPPARALAGGAGNALRPDRQAPAKSGMPKLISRGNAASFLSSRLHQKPGESGSLAATVRRFSTSAAVLQGTQPPEAAPKFIDPSMHHNNEEVHRLALAQTQAARNALYHPGDELRREIGKAASALLSITRQLSKNELKTLSKRLFSPAGLLPGHAPDYLLGILGRLERDTESTEKRASATDRAAFISIMGDLGALYGSVRTGAATARSEDDERLKTRLTALIEKAGLAPISKDVVARVESAIAVNGATVAQKRAERKKADDLVKHVGVHNRGIEADEMLGIPGEERIPSSRYPLWLLDSRRVKAVSEPLVAHLSGSPGEILMIWDMLRGESSDHLYTKVLDKQRDCDDPVKSARDPMGYLTAEERNARLARLAGACAMLLGVGHHSAVEVVADALTYTGQSPRTVLADNEDATHLLGEGAATDLISELIVAQTKS